MQKVNIVTIANPSKDGDAKPWVFGLAERDKTARLPEMKHAQHA